MIRSVIAALSWVTAAIHSGGASRGRLAAESRLAVAGLLDGPAVPVGIGEVAEADVVEFIALLDGRFR